MAVISLKRTTELKSDVAPDVADVASASKAPEPDQYALVISLFLLVAGGAAGCGLGSAAPAITLKPTASPFALFYIVAQALERAFEFLQLILPRIGSTRAGTTAVSKQEAATVRDAALARAISEPTQALVTEAAEAQTTVDRVRLNRALLAWTSTSALAMVVSGQLGLRLLATVADYPAGLVSYIDVIVTGLVIGAGTKPLHDLTSLLQKAKTTNEDRSK